MTIQNSVKSVLTAVLLSAIGSTALAQGSPELVGGSAEEGAGKVTACVACHGQSGNESVLPNVPKLGGQGAPYLLKQLVEIKTGVRVVPLMAGILDPLSEEDLEDIAAYYASLDTPLGAVDPEKRELGEALYRAGNESIGVAACSACHLPNGKGIDTAAYPSLSGQDVGYTTEALRAFRAGTRDNDPAGIMRSISSRLTDREIEALASFVSGLR